MNKDSGKKAMNILLVIKGKGLLQASLVSNLKVCPEAPKIISQPLGFQVEFSLLFTK